MTTPESLPASLCSELTDRAPFAALSEAEIERLLASAEHRCFAAGEPLIEENRSNDWLYLMVEGDADVVMNGTKIGHIGAGDIVGEISTAGISPPVASVIATTPVQTLAFASRALRQIARANPSFARALVKAGLQRISSP